MKERVRRNTHSAARQHCQGPLGGLLDCWSSHWPTGAPICRRVRQVRKLCNLIGGPGRDRTDDLFHAMEARSQLRHRPTRGGKTHLTINEPFSFSTSKIDSSNLISPLEFSCHCVLLSRFSPLYLSLCRRAWLLWRPARRPRLRPWQRRAWRRHVSRPTPRSAISCSR
jgi:hypothetical protein